MKVIIGDLAKKCLDDIFYYNLQYSLKNAIFIDENITKNISKLEFNPYLGRHVPKYKDKRFRELIYKKNRNQGYRIVYYVSKLQEIIHVLYVANLKQNFKSILKIHNYFNNYLEF